jgi:hypothetical protein
MKLGRQTDKAIPEEIGGQVQSFVLQASHPLLEDTAEDDLEIYSDLPSITLPKRHSPQYINQRLKLKHVAEARLLQFADELSKLADEVRYLNPVIAEAIDDAWTATDMALELLDQDI